MRQQRPVRVKHSGRIMGRRDKNAKSITARRDRAQESYICKWIKTKKAAEDVTNGMIGTKLGMRGNITAYEIIGECLPTNYGGET